MTGRHPYQKTDLTAYLYVIKLHMGEGWGGVIEILPAESQTLAGFSVSLSLPDGRTVHNIIMR